MNLVQEKIIRFITSPLNIKLCNSQMKTYGLLSEKP